ncbi:hypothetical protein VNO78_03265 [Psophocarpus tetragonolobus]|uniref:Uncharacterized protein n=1 Tax=Psophocarpus tetragonolobus TaxID=3891 RepID=A0AAN9T3Z5_PSOTE
MNVLDSNVEALAFNYLSFGVLTALNNLWTWVALITAALSFWKIRSKPKPKPEAQALAFAEPEPVTAEKTEAAPEVVVGNGVAEDVDGVTRGKFTVYYEDDVDMQCTCEETEQSLTACGEGSETEWWRTWERLLRLRNGESEKGWYTWQDVTELNGNVVRLWDGGLSGSFARESWYNNSSCIHVW